MLSQLRSLPLLSALQISLSDPAGGVGLLHERTPKGAAAALGAVLPTQLRSFTLSASQHHSEVNFEPNPLFSTVSSTFVAALSTLPYLTAFSAVHKGAALDVPLAALAQLPQLRTLSLSSLRWTDQRVAEVKQLSQLRDLDISVPHDELAALCQPPHVLQLERIDLRRISADGCLIRALLHIPTLTELAPCIIYPDAWPLLPQFPLLLRLTVNPCSALSDARATLLATSLSGCHALIALEPRGIVFEDADGEDATDAQQQARWAEIAQSATPAAVRGSNATIPFPAHCVTGASSATGASGAGHIGSGERSRCASGPSDSAGTRAGVPKQRSARRIPTAAAGGQSPLASARPLHMLSVLATFDSRRAPPHQRK
jgi:hypothetical protein